MSAVLEAEVVKPVRKRMRNYSDQEKAQTLALLDNLGNVSEVSRITNIPIQTISGWNVAKRGINEDITLLREGKSLELASKLEDIAYQAAKIVPSKLKSASLRDLMGAIHISVPAFRLLRDQPTSITASSQAIESLRDKLAEAIELARQKAGEKNGQDDPAGNNLLNAASD